MSKKRFKVCIDSNNGVGLFDNSVKLLFIKFTNKEDAVTCKNSLQYQCNLMNELHDENEQLRKRNKFLEEFDGRTETFANLKEENGQLKETNEKLQWELDKTRKDLNYFANLKVGAMRGSNCSYDRCYVTSMQKKGD